MIRILLFCTLLTCVFGYAIRYGGGPERAVAITLIAGALSTWAVAIGFHGSIAGHFIRVEHGVLLIDSIMLVVFTTIALTADRFWRYG